MAIRMLQYRLPCSSANTPLRGTGDLIAIQTPALHTPRKWPGPENPSLVFNRSDLHTLLYEYARSVGIQILFDTTVAEYYETADSAGVVLSDGLSLEADLVVAADGVGSKSWGLVIGQKEVPISSGFALYRVTFPAGPALKNPIIAKEFEGYKDKIETRVGPNVHVVIGKTEKTICWVLTHRVSVSGVSTTSAHGINSPFSIANRMTTGRRNCGGRLDEKDIFR